MKRASWSILAMTVLSLSAHAATSTCKSGAAERKVEVTSAEGGKAPCEVKYTKEGEAEGKTLWSAQNDADYCSTKASELVGKLTGMGWQCSGDFTAAADKVVPEKGPVDEKPGAEAKAVEGKTEGN